MYFAEGSLEATIKLMFNINIIIQLIVYKSFLL
jgi:hypothetical protein